MRTRRGGRQRREASDRGRSGSTAPSAELPLPAATTLAQPVGLARRCVASVGVAPGARGEAPGARALPPPPLPVVPGEDTGRDGVARLDWAAWVVVGEPVGRELEAGGATELPAPTASASATSLP